MLTVRCFEKRSVTGIPAPDPVVGAHAEPAGVISGGTEDPSPGTPPETEELSAARHRLTWVNVEVQGIGPPFGTTSQPAWSVGDDRLSASNRVWVAGGRCRVASLGLRLLR